MTFFVTGGVYTDTTFKTLEEGTAESYGPFATYDEAYIKWLQEARFKVDNACHRLTITPQRITYTLDEEHNDEHDIHEDREFL